MSLSRDLQIGYHAAWLMLHKLREAMSERDFHYILSGVVEVDDAYFGGRTDKEESGDKHHTGRFTAVFLSSFTEKKDRHTGQYPGESGPKVPWMPGKVWFHPDPSSPHRRGEMKTLGIPRDKSVEN